MYAVNPNPSYPCFKYTKGFIRIRVGNVHNYKAIIDILNRNWMKFDYSVKNYPPIGANCDLCKNFYMNFTVII